MASNFKPEKYPMDRIKEEVFKILGPEDEILPYKNIVDAVHEGKAPVLSDVIFSHNSKRFQKYRLNLILQYLGGEPWTRANGQATASWRFSR